jgi:hypothetical protein
MAWEPDSNVVKNSEIIGRRAFGPEQQIRDPKGRTHFRLDLFIEPVDRDLSFDRLGENKTNGGAVAFLSPLGHAHGERLSPRKEFLGWAAIAMKELDGLAARVKPTPAANERNPYHAELSREGAMRDPESARLLAFKLSCIASRELVQPRPKR